MNNSKLLESEKPKTQTNNSPKDDESKNISLASDWLDDDDERWANEGGRVF